jgi:predicted dehydrogenase
VLTTEGNAHPPIRVGLVGAGMMGMTHSLAWANVSTLYWPEDSRVVRHRLADATDELARRGAQQLGWNEATSDWHDITGADDIDVVDVVVPNFLHHDVVVDAVRHGKDVFCEKPLSIDLGEAREMYAEAERAGVIHQTGFVYRSYPGVVLARKLVADGRIGEVRYFRGEWLSDWAADPSIPHTWRFVRAVAGAGVLTDTGSHILDLARFVVGDEVSRVLARSKTFIAKRELPDSPGETGLVDTDDLTDMMLEFDGGAIASICLSRTYPGHNTDMRFEVVGSKGSIEFSWIHPGELKFYSLDDPEEIRGVRTILIGKAHPNAEAFWGRGIVIGYTDAFLIQFHQLIQEMQSQVPGRATFLDGLRNAEIIDAAATSTATENWVDIARYEPR